MYKLKKTLMVAAVAVITTQVIRISYSDLTWSSNSTSYIIIFLMFALIAAVSILHRHQQTRKAD